MMKIRIFWTIILRILFYDMPEMNVFLRHFKLSDFWKLLEAAAGGHPDSKSKHSSYRALVFQNLRIALLLIETFNGWACELL